MVPKKNHCKNPFQSCRIASLEHWSRAREEAIAFLFSLSQSTISFVSIHVVSSFFSFSLILLRLPHYLPLVSSWLYPPQFPSLRSSPRPNLSLKPPVPCSLHDRGLNHHTLPRCHLSLTPEAPNTISLSLPQVIDYEGRGGVRVHTQNGRDTVSHLLVKEAGPGDTGRYTCSPSNGESASVMLHVLNGE